MTMPSRSVLFAARRTAGTDPRRCLGERTCVVAAASWLDLAGAAALTAEAVAALAGGARDFVLDLTAVVLIGSAAAATLEELAEVLLNAGGDIVVAAEDPDVVDSLQALTGWRDFPTIDSVAAALAFLLSVPVGE